MTALGNDAYKGHHHGYPEEKYIFVHGYVFKGLTQCKDTTHFRAFLTVYPGFP
jgi:hypothetical protein